MVGCTSTVGYLSTQYICRYSTLMWIQDVGEADGCVLYYRYISAYTTWAPYIIYNIDLW